MWGKVWDGKGQGKVTKGLRSRRGKRMGQTHLLVLEIDCCSDTMPGPQDSGSCRAGTVELDIILLLLFCQSGPF